MSSTGVEDETILEVLRSAETPRLTTTEVAGKLPITRGRTRTRLQQLADEGLVERETAGNDVVWWLPEREEELAEWEEEQAVAETSAGESEEPAEETAEAEPAQQAKAETKEGPAEIEVEAVTETEPDVETPVAETETRTAAERRPKRPELSPDEEGLRTLALFAGAVVVFALLRKVLGE